VSASCGHPGGESRRGNDWPRLGREMTVALFLVSVAGIFIIGALGEIIFQRTNVPDVIWLILAGIVLGPVSGIVGTAELRAIAPYFAAITLVVVLFEGGSTLKLSELSRAAPRSTVLALSTFLLAASAMAVISMLARVVGWLPKEWTWSHGWMLGTILGGSSSIIIMPAMAQARVEPKVANLVNLESALTDALCVVGTVAIIDVILGGSTGAAGPVNSLLRSFGIGLALGGVAGLVWLLLLRFLHAHEHAYPVTLSALLILYVVIERAGGSAALGILTVAVILGNAPVLSKKIGLAEPVELDTSVRGFHRQMAFIIKSFFFVFIGAMLRPPWSLILLGVIFGAVLFASRLPGVMLALLSSDFDRNQKRLAAVAMPRGMAAGVLATLPASAGVPGTEGLPVAVFACVFTTILIFAVGFPIVQRRVPTTAEPASYPVPAGGAPPSIRPPPDAPSAVVPDVSPGGAGAGRVQLEPTALAEQRGGGSDDGVT
jgi:cell volume regulation protein A